MTTIENKLCMKDAFELPGEVYMCGHSVGPWNKAADDEMQQAIQEWKTTGVGVWGTERWINAHIHLGNAVAPLIGASVGNNEVVVSDHTSANLYKLLALSVNMRNTRHTIITDENDFPANRYGAKNLAEFTERHTVLSLPAEQILESIDDTVAVVSLSHVDFRTSQVRDMQAITERAHECGALVLWDLSHSVGVMPVDVKKNNIDFAVGCTYKYLNGGPGNMGFSFINEKHHDRLKPALYGWLGHANPFAFEPDYRPAPGAQSMHIGTQPIMNMLPLHGALSYYKMVDMNNFRHVGQELSGALINGVTEVGNGLTCLSPLDAEKRGGHVALFHTQAHAISNALKDLGLGTDHRKYTHEGTEGGIFRLSVHPLYHNGDDILRAIDIINNVVGNGIYKQPQHQPNPNIKVH